jgi:hypothetical protein
MTNLIDDYLREVESTLRVDAARKRQIVDELRSHLRDKTLDLAREDPAMPQEEVERRVLAEMGSPRDLAFGYEPDGSTTVMTSAGETILRIGAAVGRGTGRVLKWVAIGMAVLLVLAIGVGIWAFYEVKPFAEAIASESDPVYYFEETCRGTPCNGAMPSDTFFVTNATKTIRFELDLYHVHGENTDVQVGNGTVHILVRSPDNATRLDRQLNMTNATSLSTEMTWAAQPGEWSVSVSFEGFQGNIALQAYARAVWPGSDD